VGDIYGSMRQPPPAERHDRLVALFEAHHVAVLGYLARRSGTPEQAADAFSEVFLVAWRRLDDVPAAPREARLWLYGVARRTLANARRAFRRRDRLVARLAATLPRTAFVAPGVEPADAGLLRTALAQLPPDDAELLRLVAWEGLGPSEAAEVLGLSPEAARSRLHRARARLRSLRCRRGRSRLRGHLDVGHRRGRSRGRDRLDRRAGPREDPRSR
jgi:RNA polymerase sigma-70 factor, ECF subfamily